MQNIGAETLQTCTKIVIMKLTDSFILIELHQYTKSLTVEVSTYYTTCLHRVPCLRMRGAVPSLPLRLHDVLHQ